MWLGFVQSSAVNQETDSKDMKVEFGRMVMLKFDTYLHGRAISTTLFLGRTIFALFRYRDSLTRFCQIQISVSVECPKLDRVA